MYGIPRDLVAQQAFLARRSLKILEMRETPANMADLWN